MKKCGVHGTIKSAAIRSNIDVNEINDYFTSTQNNGPPDFQLLQFYYNNTLDNVDYILHFVEVTVEEIEKALLSISSESVGSDGISLETMLSISPSLHPTLIKFLNY